jgi:hypothetical protein
VEDQKTAAARLTRLLCRTASTVIENPKVMALPHDKLRAVLKKYNRLTDQ